MTFQTQHVARKFADFAFVAWLALVSAGALAGCAQLPAQSKVKAFADATGSAATVLQSSIDLNASLAQSAGEDKAALAYLVGKPYELPSKDFRALSDKVLKPRRELIDAIAKYATALGAAADPATIKDLEAAATSLASTFGQDVAPLVGGAAVPFISPAAQIAGQIVGLAVASQQAMEIRAVMSRTHPFLQAAAQELKQSIAIIVRNNKTQFEGWTNARIALLDQMRDDRKSNESASAAVPDLRTAIKDARNAKATIAALERYTKLLDAMVKAHASLIEPNEGPNTDLTTFLALVKQATGLFNALKPAG